MDERETVGVPFADFMAQEQASLLRFAAALTGDGRLAEDVVADVLGRAYERWRRIGHVEHPRAYVRRMIVNEFLSRKRRQRRHIVLLEEHTDLVPDPASGHAERAELKARLGSLPRRQRVAIVLRYYEGLPTREIASVLGCAEPTVRSLISRALTALRVDPGPGVGSARGHDEQESFR